MTRYNNRLLSFILIALIGIYVLAKLFVLPGRKSNMQTTIFKVDSASVSEVDIYPVKEGRKEIKLIRQGANWELESGQHQAPPVSGIVQELLSSLANVPVQRMVAQKKDNWDEYKVGDTSGTHVLVYAGKTPAADFWIGAGAPMDGNIYGGGVSYVRMNDHDEVYAVDGYMYTLFNKSFSEWRNRSLLRLNKNDVVRISFAGAGGGFMVSKKDSVWMLGSEKAEADSVNRYLTSLESKNLSDFDDNFHPSGEPDETIGFGGASAEIATVKAWKQPDGTWVLNSSERPDTYFSVGDAGMQHDFLRGPENFVRK